LHGLRRDAGGVVRLEPKRAALGLGGITGEELRLLFEVRLDARETELAA